MSNRTSPIKVLLVGANGQLGQEIVNLANHEPYRSSISLHPYTKNDLDITQPNSVYNEFEKVQPDYVINAAAYTAVDKAETEQSLAFLINAEGPKILAEQALKVNSRLIHISTDYVFDGAGAQPYMVDHSIAPINAYGASKAEGEKNVLTVSKENQIIRTGWVYSYFGNNFVKTMLKLMNERKELSIVDDQIGTPTWARTLADVTLRAALRNQPDKAPVLHWSNAGVASWYDFAIAIYEEASQIGLINSPCNVLPTAASHYPSIAKRPSYSVLDKNLTINVLKPEIYHWREALRAMLQEHAALLAKGKVL